MTMLTVVQHFCRRTNLTVPTTVYGSTDDQVLQIMAILEEEGNELSGRGDWQELTNEAVHTTLAAESQGTITSIASNNFRYIKSNTAWDRSSNLPLIVTDGVDWQEVKGSVSTNPRYSVRIRGGNLISNPAPSAGDTWAFEYITWNWLTDTNDANDAQYFAADSDKILLPEPIILMGLRWRWKKEKGLDYEEDFNTYEGMVKDALGREGMNKNLNMGNGPRDAKPGYGINQGNWNL